jgi:hypothetical protein
MTSEFEQAVVRVLKTLVPVIIVQSLDCSCFSLTPYYKHRLASCVVYLVEL